MKKLTQQDLCVLYLAFRGGWVRVVEMRGIPFRGTFIGSEADKRMYEVMETVQERGYFETEGIRYVVETSKEGKFTTYRVVGSKPRPKPVYVPNGKGAMVETWPNGRP